MSLIMECVGGKIATEICRFAPMQNADCKVQSAKCPVTPSIYFLTKNAKTDSLS